MSGASYIDTHCHLYASPLGECESRVVAEARESGVKGLIVPGVDEASSACAIEMAARHIGVWAAAGVHPQMCDCGEVRASTLGELARRPKVVAIGEIGLDFEVGRPGPEEQEMRFRTQMELAWELGLPVLVHCRKAFGRTVEILREFGAGPGGILHSWAGSAQMLDALWDLGYCCGVSGVITRPGAKKRRKIVSEIPLERTVLETDSPYIGTERSPKGEVAPADIPEICRALAEIHGVSEEEAARVTTRNARNLLKLEAWE